MACDNSHLDGYLYSLRMPTLAKLSHLLNPTKVLLSDEGHLRDWRGLAELMGCEMLTIQNIEKTSNPCGALISQAKNVTVNQLIEYLEKMDRYDVVDDTIALMENDLYLASRQQQSEQTQQDIPQLATIGDLEHLKEKGTLLEYDAFLLYAREDQEFVDKVIEKMEGEYGMKLCLKDRDLMAGLPFEHKIVTELISNRCRFVLPIFSPDFLNSEDNKFIVNFSEALGIEKGCRKIVPCVYKNCDLPKSVRYYTRLDFTRQNQYWDLWDKMRKSIANPSTAFSEKLDQSNTASNPEKKNFTRFPSERDISEKSKSKEVLPATSSKQPTVQPSSSSPTLLGDLKEKHLQEAVSQEQPDKENKHWLKKIWKKSKKKTTEKKKVKVAAL